jgi:hypothetical protein
MFMTVFSRMSGLMARCDNRVIRFKSARRLGYPAMQSLQHALGEEPLYAFDRRQKMERFVGERSEKLNRLQRELEQMANGVALQGRAPLLGRAGRLR